jgi:predicted DNA-binding protein
MAKGGARPNSGPKVDPLGYLVPFTLRIPESLRDRLELLSIATERPARQVHREMAEILIESMEPPSQR